MPVVMFFVDIRKKGRKEDRLRAWAGGAAISSKRNYTFHTKKIYVFE